METLILQKSQRNVDKEMLGCKDTANTWSGDCRQGDTMFPNRELSGGLTPRWWHSAGLTTRWLWNNRGLSRVALSFLGFPAQRVIES